MSQLQNIMKSQRNPKEIAHRCPVLRGWVPGKDVPEDVLKTAQGPVGSQEAPGALGDD